MAVRSFPPITINRLYKKMPVLIEAGTSLLIHGPVGVGKSSSLRSWAKENEFDYIEMYLSQMDAVDLRGLVTTQTKPDGSVVMVWARPNELPAEGCRPTLLVLEEFYAAQPEVQTAATQLILDRKIGEYTLPDNVFVIGITNDDDHGSFNTSSDNRAINTRVAHYLINENVEEWLEWGALHNIHPTILAWIRIQPECLYDHKAAEQGLMAFANPRSLESVSNLMWSIERIEGKSELMSVDNKISIAGRIGEASLAKLSFVVDSILSLKPLAEFVSMYETKPSSVKKIAPNTLQSLYGLAYSLTQVADTGKEVEISIGIMLECCKIKDALSRKEVFSMFMELISKKLERNSQALSYVIGTDVFQEAFDTGMTVVNWTN